MIYKLRRFFLRHLRKVRFLPSKLYVKIHYEYFSGNHLDLNNPKDFTEKIAWYKGFYRPKSLNQLVDKFAVRAFVEEKIGSQFLNTFYGVFDDVNEIKFDELPEKFVIKATHTSGHNLIVRDKNKLNLDKTKKLLKKWLKINQYYRIGQEWAYKDVKPRIIIEKYLEQIDQKSLTDFKFYCFDGKAKFIDIHTDREDEHKQGSFDLNFERLPFGVSRFKQIYESPEKPVNLKEMIECAEVLSEKLPFVRVDFYAIDGKTIFGEMTFYPSDGRKKFYPEKYNRIIGDYFTLPKIIR
ncbi:MAG: glycosyltransferase [Bacteroidetes bacterium]|nr:glycosyltransferase [Bacteroidota bacterium]